MSIGMIGQKCGMTRVFKPDGNSIPVTVLKFYNNRITQIKSVETDGYNSIQVLAGERKASKVNKAMAGHFSKANVEGGDILREFRLDEASKVEYQLGDELSVTEFEEGQYVDVQGRSIGKGFAGNVKRNNFSTQDMTHGNSKAHRASGSIGQNQTPGRVFKGKKMAGHMGHQKVKMQNLRIVSINSDKGLIMVKGPVPGPVNGHVIISPAVKHLNKA